MKENKSSAFLRKDFYRITKKDNDLFSVGLEKDYVYIWNVLIFGPKHTAFSNGIFSARMVFPINYPDSPPTFKFITKMWHPNIETGGDVCISILHTPGDDIYGYEKLSERWLPVRTPESVIISIASLLNSPNCESPANIEAAQEYKNDFNKYEERVKYFIRKYC